MKRLVALAVLLLSRDAVAQSCAPNCPPALGYQRSAGQEETPPPALDSCHHRGRRCSEGRPGISDPQGEMTMPFKSTAQKGFLYARHPDLAEKFQAETPKGVKLPGHVKKPADKKITLYG